jgi:hypothetical protein
MPTTWWSAADTPVSGPIQLTRAAVARSDERDGRDGPLLKQMGALRISFET